MRVRLDVLGFGGGWKVNAELPGPAAFAGATQLVRPEDVAASIPCGPGVAAQVEAGPSVRRRRIHPRRARPDRRRQQPKFRFAERERLPALRAEYGVYVFDAGRVSAADRAYTVVPQRTRLATATGPPVR